MEPQSDQSATRRPPSTAVHAVWGLVIIAILAAGLYAYSITINKVDEGMRDLGTSAVEAAKATVDKGAEVAIAIATNFRSGTIQETFQSELAVFQNLQTGNLEVAVTDPVPETFSRTDSRKIFWDWVDLGQTVSEIKVPATYRYHVPLDGVWRVDVVEGICIVVAPAVMPSLPVAIHTDRMEKKTSSGWARFDKHENLFALEKTLTARLEEKALSPAFLTEAREKARVPIAKFVRDWLISEDQWDKARLHSVVVLFPGDPKITGPLRPTLSIGPVP